MTRKHSLDLARTIKRTRAAADKLAESWSGLDAVQIAVRADHLRSMASIMLAEAVELARAEGHTWQTIADGLGTTRQAAHERFGQASQGASAARAGAEPATLEAPESRPKRQSTQDRRGAAPEVLQGNRASVRRQQRATRRSES